ncbi:sugar phosphate isomerase/epimerase family protein, partial [Candidatus Latescibacterota bacterium]
MLHRLSRREAIAQGAVSSGLFMRPAYGQYTKEQTNKGPGREAFWEPGPDRNLERDLTPGPTPVRLANYQGWNQDSGISPGDWVKSIRESGLTAISVPPDPWGSISDSGMREFQTALKQHDVEVFEVCGYCNLLHTDELSRQKNLRHVARCIEVADRIGCLAVGTISGSRNPSYNKFIDNYAVHPDNWTRETWELLIEGLRQILDDTSGMKAVIGLEAQVTTNLDSPLAHRRIIDDVGSDRIKVTLDPINMVCLKNYFHTTELINECFDLLG